MAIVGFTFATDLGSLATFAGLLTAGVAVAMQSVLVSIVGYFFLIGKYGIRVSDRVQIGSVTGEVIDLGLVRLHLMELSGQVPTGRVVPGIVGGDELLQHRNTAVTLGFRQAQGGFEEGGVVEPGPDLGLAGRRSRRGHRSFS